MTVIEQAIKHYGAEHQVDKAIEELGELQQALLRYRQGRDELKHIAEEIADVYIMLMQLEMIYPIQSYEIDNWMQIKLSRLEKRLADEDKTTL